MEDETELCCFRNRESWSHEEWENLRTLGEKKKKTQKASKSTMLTPAYHRVSLNFLFLQLVTRDGGECIVREVQVSVETKSSVRIFAQLYCSLLFHSGQG